MSLNECIICGGQVTHLNLGVMICRACGNFHRRSIKRKIRYLCQHDNNCVLKFVGQRRMCKACRYAKCKQLKIVEFAPATKMGRKSYRKNLNGNLRQHLPSSPQNHLNNDFFKDTIRGCSSFLGHNNNEYLENLYENNFTSIIYMLNQIKHQLLYSLLPTINKIKCLKIIETDVKLKILKKAYFEIKTLYRSYLTCIHFPYLEDNRIAINNNYYMEFDQLGHFIYNTPTYSHSSCGNSSLSDPLLTKFNKFVYKFKQLDVRREDVWILIQLAIIKQAERMDLKLGNELNACRNELLSQWSSNLSKNFGYFQANDKITKFMFLNFDNEYMSTSQNHLRIVNKVMQFSTSVNNQSDLTVI